MGLSVKSSGGGGTLSEDVSARKIDIRNNVYTIANDSLDEIELGEMPNAIITSGVAVANISQPTYDEDTGFFQQSASGTVQKPTVELQGYISETEGTRNTNVISGSGTLNKVEVEAQTTGQTKYSPQVIRKPKEGSDAWTDAAAGPAVTENPQGGIYVKVQSQEKVGNLISSPSVKSEGYGTPAEGQFEAYPCVTTIGADVSLDTYVPVLAGIKAPGAGFVELESLAGSVSSESDTIGITAQDTKPTSGFYFLSKGSGLVKGRGYGQVTTTDGWVYNGTTTSNKCEYENKSSLEATRYYSIDETTIEASLDSLTPPLVTVLGEAHGFTAAASATNYFVEVGDASTIGLVKAKAKTGNKNGAIAANTTVVDEGTDITPIISGSGTKIYIPVYAWSCIIS